MKRRDFLSTAAATGAVSWLPRVSFGMAPAACKDAHSRFADVSSNLRSRGNLLILVELKGGNDGLNTVIPFADPVYYQLRPAIGVKREQSIQLDERTALHPALQPLMPLWRSGELAIVQGLGYPQFNLSHFRATEIWETASGADRYLHDGWLARAFAQRRTMSGAVLDGFVIGSPERGPLANGSRAVAMAMSAPSGWVDGRFKTAFPSDAFGASIQTAMQMLAARADADARVSTGNPVAAIPAIRLTLNGFDTHRNQSDRHAAMLAQLAQGCASLRAALLELGRWHDTLVVTYSEFGRRARENDDAGTDHGSSAPHFVMGGRVRGGLYGAAPALSRLDGNGNLPMAVDFRQLYSTVLDSWWGFDATAVLQRRFETLPLLRV